MGDIVIYFKVFGLAEDKHGNPMYGGVKCTVGQTKEQYDYDELIKCINKDVLLDRAVPFGDFTAEDMEFITADEYNQLQKLSEYKVHD